MRSFRLENHKVKVRLIRDLILDDINEIKRKIATQAKALSEFENYLGILLTVMKGSNQIHYSDLIKKVN